MLWDEPLNNDLIASSLSDMHAISIMFVLRAEMSIPAKIHALRRVVKLINIAIQSSGVPAIR